LTKHISKKELNSEKGNPKEEMGKQNFINMDNKRKKLHKHKSKG